jgi:hypothetical protein
MTRPDLPSEPAATVPDPWNQSSSQLLSSELETPSPALPLDLFSGEPMPTYEYVCTECGDKAKKPADATSSSSDTKAASSDGGSSTSKPKAAEKSA